MIPTTLRPSKFYLVLAIAIITFASQTSLFADAAPAWSLKDIKATRSSYPIFKGKVVIVDFWATWCPPCRAEIPNFIALQDKYGKQGLVIVGISVDQGGAPVFRRLPRRTRSTTRSCWRTIIPAEQYGVTEGIPTTFVIDRKGNIIAKHLGITGSDVFEKEIKSAL